LINVVHFYRIRNLRSKGGALVLEDPFYERMHTCYEFCSARFLIALSMPEKISA